MADLVHKVEGLGYSTLVLADHYLGPGPAQRTAHTPRQDLAPIAAMAAAAAISETLRIGCRVFCVDYHVPAVLAKEAATLDLLSDGRLELGIGAGWSEGEYRAMGIAFDPPGRRVEKLEEVSRSLKAHFRAKSSTATASTSSVRGYVGTPRPVQNPHPPIMIGGSKQRVLSLAGREADIASISNVPFIARNDDGLSLGRSCARVSATCAPRQASASPTLDIESSPYFTEVTNDRRRSARTRGEDVPSRSRSWSIIPTCSSARPKRSSSDSSSRRETLRINYVSVQQSQVESFAPIAARLHGS